MPRRLPQPSDDITVYLVLNDHGQFGIAYAETDPAEADRETIIRNFPTGQYSNALRVVAFNTAEGWSRDVSELCFWACTAVKQRFAYDDSLDVFGVHGVGGATGTLLTGVFAVATVGGTAGALEGNPAQLLFQFYGIAATLAWSGIVTFLLLKAIAIFVPLRVSEQGEVEGLDVTQHGEALQ
jgi:hypothetical protein